MHEKAAPELLRRAAKNLLDNQSFSVLLQHRLAELNEDVLLSVEDAAVIAARREYDNVSALAEWITQLGKDK